ncbi:DUF4848 domain-containing protein [Segatella copri]|jgi:hypothetical protein|uniref:DUF4848 domain-containing protein n=1 Tax=Segatella copri TaxID=165179 RepID=UPI001C4694EE|nr:DUF4848 domain-containing protein [Segatella copri]WOZ84325.1 DUF4848 domain-containing protein [Segatella copri]
MKKLILAMCTASLLFSCTDDDSLSTNSAPVADNNGIEVVEVSNGNVVQGTRTLGDGELALKFDSEASFQKFKNELLNESSFARTETISKYGIKNLYDLADDADAELEKIGNEATSLSDFNAKYSEYKKKYEGLLITDASDNSDVSLYVPNADSPESYIANKDGYFVVGNEVRKISVNSENYPNYPSLPSTPGQKVPSQEGTVAGTNKVELRPRSNTKIYFEAYAQGYYLRVKMSAKKHMWYGWKNDPHRQYFFDSYLDNNFVYLGQGKYGQEAIVNRLPRYIFNNEKAVKNGFDIILGKRQTAAKFTGEFHVWSDLTSEHDKDGNDITEKVGNFVMPKCLESKAQIVKIDIL